MARSCWRYDRNANGELKKRLIFEDDDDEIPNGKLVWKANNSNWGSLRLIFLLATSLVVSRLVYVYFGEELQEQLYHYLNELKTVTVFNIERILTAAAIGIGVTILTFMVTYLDSQEPGVIPPTPLSPYRRAARSSNFTLDFNYLLAVINGLAFSVVALWRSGTEIETDTTNTM